jgi:hypothetical protein
MLGWLPATFRFLEIFRFFPIFSAQTRLFLKTKVEKIFMGVFSTHFVPLISILALKKWNNEIINFKNSDVCKLVRLPISPILKIQQFPLGMLIFLILYPWSWNSITENAIPSLDPVWETRPSSRHALLEVLGPIRRANASTLCCLSWNFDKKNQSKFLNTAFLLPIGQHFNWDWFIPCWHDAKKRLLNKKLL